MLIPKSPQHLPKKELFVLNCEGLVGSNDSRQVSFHEISDQVDVANDPSFAGHKDNILKLNNVLVLHVFHDDDFTKDAFGIDLLEF
jgi:hypothetical protein